MANTKSEIGSYGEDLACKYLVSNDYKIIERNFRKPWGEIDIIAKDKDQTVVFVEVKTLRKSFNLMPEDNMSQAKITKIKRTASLWVGFNDNKIDPNKGFRVDLVAIELLNIDNPVIRHYQNL